MNIEILPPEGKSKYLGQNHHLQKRSASRARPQQEMRVGDLHEPPAGVYAVRFRNMDDDRGDEEETPDNTTTDDKDYHAHAANVDEVADDEPQDQDSDPEEDTEDTPKTPTATPCSTAYR